MQRFLFEPETKVGILTFDAAPAVLALFRAWRGLAHLSPCFPVNVAAVVLFDAPPDADAEEGVDLLAASAAVCSALWQRGALMSSSSRAKAGQSAPPTAPKMPVYRLCTEGMAEKGGSSAANSSAVAAVPAGGNDSAAQGATSPAGVVGRRENEEGLRGGEASPQELRAVGMCRSPAADLRALRRRRSHQRGFKVTVSPLRARPPKNGFAESDDAADDQVGAVEDLGLSSREKLFYGAHAYRRTALGMLSQLAVYGPPRRLAHLSLDPTAGLEGFGAHPLVHGFGACPFDVLSAAGGAASRSPAAAAPERRQRKKKRWGVGSPGAFPAEAVVYKPRRNTYSHRRRGWWEWKCVHETVLLLWAPGEMRARPSPLSALSRFVFLPADAAESTAIGGRFEELLDVATTREGGPLPLPLAGTERSPLGDGGIFEGWAKMTPLNSAPAGLRP
jgi:hypothetical protein